MQINNEIATKRFERKYYCTHSQYYALKNALYPYIQKDFFTQKAPDNKYLVRSLYFDTREYKLFFEKCGGISDRIKFRIRTYGENIKDKPDLRVEIKVRQSNLTLKYGSYISIENYLHFNKTRHIMFDYDPVLEEFERHTHILDLQPTTIIEYRREGYQTRDGENIRITFDHGIKSASSKILFPKKVFWHKHFEQMIVLEIKHSKAIQNWLNRIIKNSGLCLISNSKFALGIQNSQPDIIHPS